MKNKLVPDCSQLRLQQKICAMFQRIIQFALHIFSKLCVSLKKGSTTTENNLCENEKIGKFEKIYSDDYKTYLNLMKKTTGTPQEKWKKVKNVMIDPMVMIPILIGFGFLLWTYFTNDTIFKSLLSFISAFGLGIGINHFTFLFKEQTEYRKLKEKAEFTVRLLNDRVMSILRKHTLDDKDKDTISGLLTIMNGWKEYYDKSDTSQIAYHKKLTDEFKNETDEIEKKKKKSELDMLEYELLGSGLTSYIGLSASTAYDYYINKE